MRPLARSLLQLWLLSLCGCSSTDNTKRCQEYVTLGYCNMEHTSAYMAKHCAGLCGSGGGGEPAPAEEDEEDSACTKWAEEGYCTDPEFAAYMSRSCPVTCGFGREAGETAEADGDLGGADDDAGVEEADEEHEGEEGYEAEEIEAVAAEEGEPENCIGWAKQGFCEGSEHSDYMQQKCATTCATVSAEVSSTSSTGSGSGGPEPENCVAWAKQGLCEGEHEEYMKLNCRRACESTDVTAGASTADPFVCAQWAMRGLCDEGSAHAQYMQLNCAEQCKAAASVDPNAGTPPPAGVFELLIVAGFIYAVVYAVRRTLQWDSQRSLGVKKVLGWKHEDGIGPGKVNKSAAIGVRAEKAQFRNEAHGQKRSAKKDKKA